MHSERQPYRERWYYELFKARCFSLIPRQHIVLLLHDDDDDSETCEEQRVCKKPNIAQFEN